MGYPANLTRTAVPAPTPASSSSNGSSPLSPALVAVIGVLASAFLVLSYYRIFSKYCTRWQNPPQFITRRDQDYGDQTTIEVLKTFLTIHIACWCCTQTDGQTDLEEDMCNSVQCVCVCVCVFLLFVCVCALQWSKSWICGKPTFCGNCGASWITGSGSMAHGIARTWGILDKTHTHMQLQSERGSSRGNRVRRVLGRVRRRRCSPSPSEMQSRLSYFLHRHMVAIQFNLPSLPDQYRSSCGSTSRIDAFASSSPFGSSWSHESQLCCCRRRSWSSSLIQYYPSRAMFAAKRAFRVLVLVELNPTFFCHR